jgi:hypothetical protein
MVSTPFGRSARRHPSAEVIQRLTGPGQQEGDQFVEEWQLVRRDPQEALPGRIDPVAARREAHGPTLVLQPLGHVRGHEPERLLAPPCILLLEALHLPGLSPKQSTLDRLPVEVVTGQLQLDHHLVMGLRLGPRRGQVFQELRLASFQLLGMTMLITVRPLLHGAEE